MTRKEQILKAMFDRFKQDPPLYRNAVNDYVERAFEAGAEWADANPKGLLNQDHLVVYEMLLNEQEKSESLEVKLKIATEALEKIINSPEITSSGIKHDAKEALAKIRGEK